MARMKRRNAEGKLKKINRPSPKRKETRRLQDLEKRQAFNNKKAEEQQVKDMMARQAALDELGIPLEYGFQDHKALYNYSQEQAPFNQPPIKIIDASVAPPEVTSYPEYPLAEFSSPPAFDINGAYLKVAIRSKQDSFLNATAARDFACLGRAKKIFRMSQLNRI